MREVNHRAKKHASASSTFDRSPRLPPENPEDFHRAVSPSASRRFRPIQEPASSQRMEWGRDRGNLVSCPSSRHFRRSYLFLVSGRSWPQAALHGLPFRHRPIGPRRSHELATNAGKYGALSTDKGRVLCPPGGTVDEHFSAMSWTEARGGRLVIGRRKRHGVSALIVMEAMAERSGGRQRSTLPMRPQGPDLALDLPQPRTRWSGGGWGGMKPDESP